MRRPFAKVEDAKKAMGAPREPFLECKNVRRDLSLPPEKNIVHAEPCSYIVSVDDATYKETRSAGDAFKATLTIEWAEEGAPMVKGQKAVFMVMASSDYFLRDVLAFACNTVNINPEIVGESDLENLVSRNQPLTASKRCVKVTVTNSKSKGKNKASSAGNDFTNHAWEPVEWSVDNNGNKIFTASAVNQVAEYIKRKGANALGA